MRKLSDWLKDRSASAMNIAGIVPSVVQAVGDSWPSDRPDGRKIGKELKRHSELVVGIVSLLLIVLSLSAPQRMPPT